MPQGSSPVLATGKEKVALAVEGDKGDLRNTVAESEHTEKTTLVPS